MAEIYVPQSQEAYTFVLDIAVRVQLGSADASLILAIRTELAHIDQRFAVEQVQTMQSVIDEQLAQPRFLTLLLGVLGALALAMTVSGVIGVAAYLAAHGATSLAFAWRSAPAGQTSGA